MGRRSKEPRDELIPEVLLEIIIDSLENEDAETLRGIECFSAVTEWPELRGYAIIISTIFNYTLENERNIENLEESINKLIEEDPYRNGETIETLERSKNKKQEGWIREEEIIKASKGSTRSAVVKRIGTLEKHGFIEGREMDGENWIRFTDMWKEYIKDLKSRGEEKDMYVYSMGIMIGHAVVGETRYGDKKKSLATLRVVMHALNVTDADGKIKDYEVANLYTEHRVAPAAWTTFKEKDGEKVKEIRAITSRSDGYIYFNREMLRVNELMNTRINELLMSRVRGNEE